MTCFMELVPELQRTSSRPAPILRSLLSCIPLRKEIVLVCPVLHSAQTGHELTGSVSARVHLRPVFHGVATTFQPSERSQSRSAAEWATRTARSGGSRARCRRTIAKHPRSAAAWAGSPSSQAKPRVAHRPAAAHSSPIVHCKTVKQSNSSLLSFPSPAAPASSRSERRRSPAADAER